MTIQSDKLIIEQSNEVVYQYISNLNNFGKILPEQIKNWQSTADKCTFEIEGMAKITLTVTTKLPSWLVEFTATSDKPFGLMLTCHILQISPKQCEVYNVIEADIPPLIAMMAKKPLENFSNQLMLKLKKKCETL